MQSTRLTKGFLIVGAVALAVHLTPASNALARSKVNRRPEYETVFPKPLNCGLELRLAPPPQPRSFSGVPSLKASIINSGSDTAVLCLPLDGSYGAMRLPVVAWSILPEDFAEPHSVGASPFGGIGLCGTLDPIPANAIFNLRPGQKKDIGDVGPWMQQRGSYRVRMYYTTIPFNDDTREMLTHWKQTGIRLTRCSLISNEVTLNH